MPARNTTDAAILTMLQAITDVIACVFKIQIVTIAQEVWAPGSAKMAGLKSQHGAAWQRDGLAVQSKWCEERKHTAGRAAQK